MDELRGRFGTREQIPEILSRFKSNPRYIDSHTGISHRATAVGTYHSDYESFIFPIEPVSYMSINPLVQGSTPDTIMILSTFSVAVLTAKEMIQLQQNGSYRGKNFSVTMEQIVPVQ